MKPITKGLPFWVRHTKHCPLFQFTGSKSVKVTAREYFLTLNALALTSPKLRQLIQGAVRWAKAEQRKRDKFKRAFECAPRAIRVQFSADCVYVPKERARFYELLYRFESGIQFKPEGFGL